MAGRRSPAGRRDTDVTHDESEVLPKGWYYRYVSDDLGYCPTRVWGLDELPADQAMANLYAQGSRWVVVFSDATGPRGDRTFIHIDSFDAGAMMANRLKEVDALQEIADMGYRLQDLPDGIQLATVALPVQGWYPDPTRRYPQRWWDGRGWTPHVSNGASTYIDPL
jgi:hypothetical protein